MSKNNSINFQDIRKVVIKVGTSTLTHKTGMINIRKIENIVKVLSDLQNSGKEIILVSSGAVSAGFAKLGESNEDRTLEEKQAAAAVGQCELMNMYDRLFSLYGHTVAQILITKDAVDNEERRQNVRNTFRSLINRRCIPIVNENDSVSFEGIKFGGNDTLSAYVAMLTDAELLINMSDIDGLFDKNPREFPDARLIPVVGEVDAAIKSCAGGAGSSRGTGGMIKKIEAAEIVTSTGIPMIIINGASPDILYKVFEGDFIGTIFTAHR
ncbi:Glutamate 5-kinase [bioreactor metagenome]|uniref:Glutamate 5-kinase n=1 Tax=bioreactor metagenome TaxID=1076179 RepID=A0A645BFM7_9ZZZZ|nr:glutamate 5-kinase [Oscillospiraceae bacterium]